MLSPSTRTPIEHLVELVLNGSDGAYDPALREQAQVVKGYDASETRVVVLGGGTGLSTVVGGNSAHPDWRACPFVGLKEEFRVLDVVVGTFQQQTLNQSITNVNENRSCHSDMDKIIPDYFNRSLTNDAPKIMRAESADRSNVQDNRCILSLRIHQSSLSCSPHCWHPTMIYLRPGKDHSRTRVEDKRQLEMSRTGEGRRVYILDRQRADHLD